MRYPDDINAIIEKRNSFKRRWQHAATEVVAINNYLHRYMNADRKPRNLVKRMAEESGMTRKSIYNVKSGKNEITRGLAEKTVRGLQSVFDENAEMLMSIREEQAHLGEVLSALRGDMREDNRIFALRKYPASAYKDGKPEAGRAMKEMRRVRGRFYC